MTNSEKLKRHIEAKAKNKVYNSYAKPSLTSKGQGFKNKAAIIQMVSNQTQDDNSNLRTLQAPRSALKSIKPRNYQIKTLKELK